MFTTFTTSWERCVDPNKSRIFVSSNGQHNEDDIYVPRFFPLVLEEFPTACGHPVDFFYSVPGVYFTRLCSS